MVRFARAGGLALFLLVLLLPGPAGLPVQARHAAAVCLLMAVWWITEAVPMAAASLLPLAFFPLLSILPAEDTARLYADPNIFLFMGGFMLALAMQKCELHRRIALHVIAFVGGGPRRMLGGFMLATALISMWVSNTATAVMMLPIGMAVIARLKDKQAFATALMLGIAYASSIGGAATLIGSPVNMIFAGQARALFPDLKPVDFMQWFLLAFPLAAGFLVICWAYLCVFVLRRGADTASEMDVIRGELKGLGPLSRDELSVMLLFTLTVIGWVTRADIRAGSFVLEGWTTRLGLKGVHDGTVAMAAAALLFVCPSVSGKGQALLNWEWAKKLPWDVLLLFGGGFALAESFQVTGLAAWLAKGFSVLEGVPLVWLILLLCLATAFLSELMSNTAQVTLMMPVLGAAAVTLGLHPYLLMLPATLASSLAFMMPVGTPPNAIVFGSGHVTVPQMARAGFGLNILGALWITAVTLLLMKPVFGI